MNMERIKLENRNKKKKEERDMKMTGKREVITKIIKTGQRN